MMMEIVAEEEEGGGRRRRMHLIWVKGDMTNHIYLNSLVEAGISTGQRPARLGPAASAPAVVDGFFLIPRSGNTWPTCMKNGRRRVGPW